MYSCLGLRGATTSEAGVVLFRTMDHGNKCLRVLDRPYAAKFQRFVAVIGDNAPQVRCPDPQALPRCHSVFSTQELWPGIGKSNDMALHFDFKPGMRQSITAGEYFTEVASDLVNAHLARLEQRQYLVGENGNSTLPLRIWSGDPGSIDQLQALVPWIRHMNATMERFARNRFADNTVHQFLQEVSNAHPADGVFFFELLDPAHPFTPDEANELSVGVVGGHIALMSARHVMYVELDPGLFGLSIAGHGSYLCEAHAVRVPVHVHS